MRNKIVHLLLSVALLLTMMPSAILAQEQPTGHWRDLQRQPQQDVEHIIIFVTGWQLLDACLLFDEITGFECSAKQYNPVWTWEKFKDNFEKAELPGILHRHAITYPSYSANTVNAIGEKDSKVVYYSYTGNYSFIRDTEEDSSVQKKGICQPHQQLDPPQTIDGENGYLCLPDYSKADTSIILQRVNGRPIWEGLNANFVNAFTDVGNIEKWAELVVKEFKRSPLNPDLAAVQAEYIYLVAQSAIAKTFQEYGIYDLADLSPQRALFNKRAERLQALIDSVVSRFAQNGKKVEITIIGHSQGGLVSAYWAGWNGSGVVKKDSSHVNAIVTLDSPLGRKISGSGLAQTVFKDLPPVSLVVDLPSVSLPYFREIFPGQRLELVKFPLGDYVRAALNQLHLKIFWGIDDVIKTAPSQMPIYTVRNKYDLFVTHDFASLVDKALWHDKTVHFDGEETSANHSQVTKAPTVSQDLQYVAVAGSIYSPNRGNRFIYYADGTQKQRMEIQIAAPPFNGAKQPQPNYFTVEAVTHTPMRASYNLNVVNIVKDVDWWQSSSEYETSPPLWLTVMFPDNIPAGLYDLQVSYDQFAKAATATAYEALEVVAGVDFVDTNLIVVVDRSGSMNETLQSGAVKINVIRAAASFLTQLASTDAMNHLGILGFSSGAGKVYPFSGPTAEVNSGNLNAYLAAIAGITAGGGTRVTDALLTARAWLREGSAAYRRQAIVILTDGASSDRWSTIQHAPQFAGVPVYTIGFGDSTSSFNEAELKLIAKDTGGAYYYAPNEAQLRIIYDEIQRQVTGANGIVQLDKPLYPNQVQTIEFQVDPTLRQFRLTANWDPSQVRTVNLKLVTPDGVEINEANVATALPNSAIFSAGGSWIFSTSSPKPGTWKLIATGAAFAGAAGSLRLTSAATTPLQLELALSSGAGIVGESLSTLLSLASFDPTWSVTSILNAKGTVVLPSGRRVPIDLFDDGYHGDGAADDLLFAAVIPGHLTTQVGSYILEVVVDGLLGDGTTISADASVPQSTQPFSRVFTTVRQVEAPANSDATANVASMVVRKPNSTTDYCISYANHGPGVADNVQLLVSADNAIYATANVAATRQLVSGFAFGWNLGQLQPNTSGTIATTIIPLLDSEPVELATWIGSTVPPNGTLADVDIDPVGADTINVAADGGKLHQIDAGWTLFGLNGVQPTVALLTSIFCAADGPVDLILGYEKGGLTYNPNVPAHINTLHELSALRGYWIKSNAPRTLVVNGNVIAVDTPIELNQGWNVINYLPQTAQSIQDALASIASDYTAVLGYDQGATSFYTAIPPQLSTLQIMEPGHAYWIYMKRPNTLVYHEQPSTPLAAAVEQMNQPQRPAGVTLSNQWINFFSRAVSVNQQPAPVGTLVEAFTRKGIKVGEARVVEPGWLQLMTIYGDDPTTAAIDGAVAGENIEFHINGERFTVLGASAIWTQHGDLREITLTNKVSSSYLPLISR